MQVLWTRRALLRDGALAGAAVLMGCESSPTETQDSATGVAVALSKEVYVHLLDTDSARLRFETREDVAITVVITDEAGETTRLETERSAETLTYAFDYIAENPEVDGEGDIPGMHVLHTVTLTGLTAGERISWAVLRGAGEVDRGSFRVAPAATEPVVIGWLADTMAANTTAPMEGLAQAKPDVVVHGGDLVYQTHPYDTWVETFQALVPLTSQSAVMHIVGNHEFEDQDEIEVMFDRLLQGQAGSAYRYFAFSYGNVRFIALDSESERQGYGEDVAEQHDWLQAELAAATAAGQFIIVGMHRPMFTLSKYWVEDTTDRDARHALFVEHGVQLVLCGHMHGYERWEVDGITYVVDGGGGALLYDPVEEAEAVEAARPGEADFQVTWDKSYGFTVLEVAADGSWSLTRTDAETGTVVDAV